MVLMVVPCFLNILCLWHVSKHWIQTTENTVEKGTVMERGSKRHRKKSQSQLYWSNPVFLRALLDSFLFLFLWRFIFTLHSLLSWPVKVSDIFYLMKMKGTFRSVVFCSLQKFPTSPLCANGVARACLGQQHSGLSDVFKMETGKSHTE